MNNNLDFDITNIPDIELNSLLVPNRSHFDDLDHHFYIADQIDSIIKQGMRPGKSLALYPKIIDPDETLFKEKIVKDVCSLLNSEGGNIIIVPKELNS